jgi:hypothetical protein
MKDESGFTILEVLVGSAILMVGAYAAADAMVLNAKYQRTSTSESEISQMFDRVQAIAGSEWSCTAGLAGQDYTGAITVKDPLNSNIIATEGQTSSQGNFWTLDQLRMQNVQAVVGQAGVLRGSLYLQASKNMASHIGNPILSRQVMDIYFETNPDGKIARCYTTSDTVAAAQSACQLLGGTWDTNPNGNGIQCHLPNG